jgi:hypothetical protein
LAEEGALDIPEPNYENYHDLDNAAWVK